MRLDKYLKVSRLIKRRTVANEACDAGRVLVNDKPAKASVSIKDGDKIAVGISGGKDSLTLLCALAALRRFYPKKFELCAITVDMGFEGSDFSSIAKLCE